MGRLPLVPNRPGHSPTLVVRATREMVDAVDRRGAAEGRTRSEVVREAVEVGLALLEARTPQNGGQAELLVQPRWGSWRLTPAKAAIKATNPTTTAGDIACPSN